MLRLLFVLLTFQQCLGAENKYPKCCDSDSVFKKTNSSYECVQDLDKRTQIITNATNFIENFDEGLCVEVENASVSLFRNDGGDIIIVEEERDVDFYPKCCPVDYVYNSLTHGCALPEIKLETFFRESFVKVGLPQCKIIVDVPVNTNEYFQRLNGSLYLNKQAKVYDKGQYCVDRDEKNLFIVRICHSNYDVCERIRCIRKCCADGQSFVNGSFCHNTFVHGLNFSTYSRNMDNVNDSFAVVHDGYSTPLYPLMSRFSFHLDAQGTFTMTEVDESVGRINVTRSYGVEQKIYCAEHALKKTLNNYFFFRGFPPQTGQIKYMYTGIAMTISCFFLVLTILYYCISKEKRTLFGKILISYCSTSLIAFFILSYWTFNSFRPKKGAPICIVTAFILFYLTLSIFTWMNVMCIDIYCTFGSSKSFSSRQHRSKELKRFLMYTLHGWGTPMILTGFLLIFYNLKNLPIVLLVTVDESKCIAYKNYAYFLFSTIPLAIMQICNLCLFIKTASYCLKVKREINRMNDTNHMKNERKQKFNKFRDRFGLLLKLFLIMGISFLFEAVSTFYDFKKNGTMAIIELIWDTFNSLQGLLIFLIFLLKKRIFKTFGKKVGLTKIRKISLVSSGMTQTTSLPTLITTKQ